MIAKILINNMERVVLLLFITVKQKCSMLIKVFNTDFISNLSNLCEKILEVFFHLNLKRFLDQKNCKLRPETNKITNYEVIVLLWILSIAKVQRSLGQG